MAAQLAEKLPPPRTTPPPPALLSQTTQLQAASCKLNQPCWVRILSERCEPVNLISLARSVGLGGLADPSQGSMSFVHMLALMAGGGTTKWFSWNQSRPLSLSLPLFSGGGLGAACVQGSAPCQRKHWSCEVLTPPFQIGGAAAVRRVTVRECCGTVWSWKSSGSPESRCSLEENSSQSFLPVLGGAAWRRPGAASLLFGK